MSQRKPRQGVYQSTTYLAVVLLLVILFVSAAFFFALQPPQSKPVQTDILEELQDNKEAWAGRRPASFRYQVDRSCACPAEFIEPYMASEERGERTAEYRSHVTTRSAETGTNPPQPVWIDDLFSLLEQALSDDAHITVEYDARYGYPRMVEIIGKDKAADSADVYRIRDFEVLEYD